jgi:hypothetical protein
MVKLPAINTFYSNYIKFTTDISFFFYFLLIIEFVPIYISVIESSNFSNIKTEDFLEYNFFLNYLIPSYHFKTQITCTNIPEGNIIIPRCEVNTNFYVVLVLISYFLAFITILLLCLYHNKNKRNSNKILTYVNYLFVNFYEAYSHTFVYSVLFMMVNKFLMSFDSLASDKPLNLVLFMLAFLNLFLYIMLNYFYLHTNLLIINLGYKLKSYKENNFCPTYNFILLAIKILACYRNNIIFFKMGSYNSPFSFSILLIFVLYVIFIISKFFNRTHLFIINSEFVTCRLILIFFLFYQLIYKFFFGADKYFNLVTPFNLIFGICTGCFLNYINKENLLKSGISVTQFSFILNEFLKIKDSKNEMDKFKFYEMIKSVKFHSFLNFKENKNFNIDPYLLSGPDENFLNQYLEILKRDENVKSQFDNVSSKRLFRLCCLIIYKFDATKINKFIFLIKKELNINNSLHIDEFNININYFYSSVNFGEEFEKNTKIYKMIKFYNNCNLKVLNALKNFEDIMIKSKISLDDKFFTIIFKQSQIKRQLIEELLYLFDHRKIYFDQYNFFILNYCYQYMFKDRIEGIDNLFEDRDKYDLIKNHYLSDKILNLEYSIKDDIFTIKSTSKDMSKFKGLNFEVLFPQKMRKFYLQEFRNLIQQINQNKIEFIHYVSTNDVKRVIYKFSSFQSVKDNFVYILGEYSIFHENLLITSTNEHLLNNQNMELIEKISNSGCAIIGLGLNFLDNLKEKNVKIYLNSIFSESSKSENDQKFYKLNKNLHFSNTTLNQEFKSQKISDEEFFLKKITNIKVDEKIFNVYEIQLISENLNISRNSSIKIKKTADSFEEIDVIETQSISSNGSQKSYDNKVSLKKKKLKNEKNKISIFLILFNIVLIIYSLIFLYIGFSLDQDLKKFYSFRSSFHDLRYFFYHTYMNLFQNIFVYKENTQDISNYFEVDFFAKFSSNPEVKVDVASYCIDEFNLKVDILKQKITDFEKLLHNNYKIGDLEVKKYLDTDMEMVLLSRSYDNTSFDVEKIKIKIFEAVGLYLNLAYKSFEPGNPFTNIYFITQDKRFYDFSNIIYQDLKESETSVYNIFMNYDSFYNKFEDLAKELDLQIELYIQSIWTTVTFLSVILVILHFCYLLLSLLIIKEYDGYLSDYCIVISQLLNDKNIGILNKKVFLTENLISPFNKSPLKILDELKQINEDQSTKRKMLLLRDKKNKIKNNNNNIDKSNDGSNDEYSLSGLEVKTIIINDNKFYTSKYEMKKIKKSKENMLGPFIKFIFCLFLIYFLAFFSMFLFWNSIHNHMVFINNYSNEFMNNNNIIINNVLLFQAIIANNQTDYQLSQILNNQGSKGQVRTNIINSYERFKILKKYEIHDDLQPVVDYKKQVMDCKSGYKIEDLIYSRFQDKSDKLLPTLEQVCKTYPFMNGGSFDKIQSELLYNNLVLLNTYEQSDQDYTKMKAIWDDFNFYDVFIIFLLIIRPISDYIVNNFIFPLVINMINYYLLFSLVYLILNILADIVIFILIKIFIINKIQKNNNEIKEFILWL